MSDYSESGATPVEDAAVEDPPTVDEVAERQRRDHPGQAATAVGAPGDQPTSRDDEREGGR